VLLVLDVVDVASDHVVWHTDKVVRGTGDLAEPNQPLGRIPMVPLDTVTVVLGELVVEVVVSLTKGEQGTEPAVVAGMVGAEVLHSSTETGVGKGVDEESGVVDNHHLQQCSVEVATSPITPTKAADESRGKDAATEGDGEVVVVLEHDDGVRLEVTDIHVAVLGGVGVGEHPTDVGEVEAAIGIVGVLVGVDVAVVDTVVTSPPLDGALEGASTGDGHDPLEGLGGREGAVAEQAVVPHGDTEAIDEVEDEPDDGSVLLQGNSTQHGSEHHQGRGEDEGARNPVDATLLELL